VRNLHSRAHPSYKLQVRFAQKEFSLFPSAAGTKNARRSPASCSRAEVALWPRRREVDDVATMRQVMATFRLPCHRHEAARDRSSDQVVTSGSEAGHPAGAMP